MADPNTLPPWLQAIIAAYTAGALPTLQNLPAHIAQQQQPPAAPLFSQPHQQPPVAMVAPQHQQQQLHVAMGPPRAVPPLAQPLNMPPDLPGSGATSTTEFLRAGWVAGMLMRSVQLRVVDVNEPRLVNVSRGTGGATNLVASVLLCNDDAEVVQVTSNSHFSAIVIVFFF